MKTSPKRARGSVGVGFALLGVLSLLLVGCDTPGENAREGPLGSAAPQTTIPQERNAPSPQISPTHPATSGAADADDEQHIPDTMRAGEHTPATSPDVTKEDEAVAAE